MAFDQKIRNLLQRTVTACRSLLDAEFTAQLQEVYGIQPDGVVTPLAQLGHLGDEDAAVAALLRDRLNYLEAAPAEQARTRMQAKPENVRRVIREQAFTILNRLAALRLAEERGLVQECVRRSADSDGFKLFHTSANGALGDSFATYRIYLGCLFEELAYDLGVLFDRFSPMGLLFPRRDALEAVLKELNGTGRAAEREEITPEQFAEIWKADETIGWIYQYYNDPAERKKMRDESAAPRNSRELAVRNQFFTPRYVVEFLTDNTLGRIWYEMARGDTKLKELCRYLVRRPNENFLKPGETTPEQPKQDNLSQEDLLKQPVFIPHRSLKDPRTILMLDPACGSMHFGLYAFDLLEVIYDEAWELEEKLGAAALSRPVGMKSLHHSYADKDAFLKDVPRLIIEHNIHGIDIDPRCAQIAGLSLWLRAQKAWQRMNLPTVNRPRIMKSNIVCAEPMPGDKAALAEFVEREFPAEKNVFLPLLEKIFEKMTLAGEAGSLLKIEEEIRSAVAEAKQKWREGPKLEQPKLFGELEPAKQKELTIDLSGITDEQFWDTVENRIYDALRDYAEQAENGGGFQRRLFADDAARGFAFIDVCRKRYDVALMNPPFGDCTDSAKSMIFAAYGRERIELGGCFITRFTAQLTSEGKLGVIANRTLLFAASLEEWRNDQLAGVEAVIDLGHGVLDALVETAALTLTRSDQRTSLFLGAIDAAEKDVHIANCVDQVAAAEPSRGLFRNVSEFRALFGAPFAYWAPASLIAKASQMRASEVVGGIARQGLATCDNFRFIRLAQEIPADADGWVPLTKGGEYQPFWADVPLRVKWFKEGAEVKAYIDCLHGQWSRVVQSTNLYGVPGATYSERTASSLSLRVLPRDSIFDKVGPFVGAEVESRSIEVALSLIGISYTTPYRFLIETSVGLRDGTTSGSAARHYLPSMVQRLPWPECSNSDQARLLDATRQAIEAARELVATQEPNGFWHEPLMWSEFTTVRDYANARFLRWCKILERIYASAEILEELSLRIFAIDSSDKPALEAVAGRSVFSFEKRPVSDAVELLRLIDLPADQLIAELVAAGKAHSTIYKKGYWGDRNLELISQLWEIHPQSLLDALQTFKPSSKWEADSAWRVLSACFGLAFGHIQHSQFFKPTRDVLAEDLFSLKRQPILKIPSPEPAMGSIYCDDSNDSSDIVRKVQEILSSSFQGRGPEEICEFLGKSHGDLRQLISQEVFARHLSDYSDYRRQAPIYWPLSTASGSYTLWLYYHRLNEQTLYKCIQNFVDPKLAEVEKQTTHLRTVLAAEEGSGKERRKLEELEDLRRELKDFRAELERWAGKWKPNLNDGVLITACPLWKLFALPKWRKDLEACWKELERGDYDWAHLAYTLWPERVREKCETDRSLAIAHDLEELCTVKAPEKKVKKAKKKTKQAEEDPELIKE